MSEKWVCCECGEAVSDITDRWVSDARLSREEYTTEKRQGGITDKTTVTIEWIDKSDDVDVEQMRYQPLEASPEQLALVCGADRLSKRGLMDVGLSDSQSMRLLAQLLSFGYISRQADNMPAEWTSKGKALRRAFAGGGGGGGVVVDAPPPVNR